MPHPTRLPAGTHEPRTIEFAPTASDGHRVIYHEPICPDCGSFDITENEVDTGDGISELGLTCEACGTAWPVGSIGSDARVSVSPKSNPVEIATTTRPA